MNNDKRSDTRSPSMYNFMSGDSSDLHKKKDEEGSLVFTDRLKGPIATVATASTATAITEVPTVIPEHEDKLIKHDNGDNKEAAGDANSKDDDYLDSKEPLTSSPDDKNKLSTDKVDGVYVSSGSKVPPRSTASLPEEEDCAIKCLYYTLQCCDCVLM